MGFSIGQLRWGSVIAVVLAAVVAVMVWGGEPVRGGGEDGFVGGGFFDATLSGDQEDPPVETDASGTFSGSLEGDTIPYEFVATNLVGVTGVHLHVDPDDGLGPAVAFPFSANGEGEDGSLAAGTLTAADLIGPLEGQTIADLVAVIEAGNAYVNIHTKANPGGEIRGPIFAAVPVIGPGPELLGTLSLNAGGQFVF